MAVISFLCKSFAILLIVSSIILVVIQIGDVHRIQKADRAWERHVDNFEKFLDKEIERIDQQNQK